MKKTNLLLLVLIPFLALLSSAAFADIMRTSEVSTVVTDNMDGTFTYNYTVINTSDAPQFEPFDEGETPVWPTIVDYEIPIPGPEALLSIFSPASWDHEFLSAADYETRFGEANPFGAPFILHWFTSLPFPIVPLGFNAEFSTSFYENSVDGFIITSPLSPVDGPYLASWQDEFREIADPPLPGGTVGGGGTIPFNPIPEPSTYLLLGVGILGLLVRRFKRPGA